ncbi:MAG: hypothetical protein NUV57_01275 [archaeon]|nr:hypothetical protein [archaeon]
MDETILKILTAGIMGIFIGSLFTMAFMQDHNMEDMNTDAKRTEFIELKESIQGDLMPNTKYRCCLEKACTYCIEKTPGHGEDAVCDCLADILNGVHPCGECIGEILEGHGNPLLAEYFARAIAEKVGEAHKETLKQIIFEKYEFPLKDQL